MWENPGLGVHGSLWSWNFKVGVWSSGCSCLQLSPTFKRDGQRLCQFVEETFFCHTTRITKSWFESKNITVIAWPTVLRNWKELSSKHGMKSVSSKHEMKSVVVLLKTLSVLCQDVVLSTVITAHIVVKVGSWFGWIFQNTFSIYALFCSWTFFFSSFDLHIYVTLCLPEALS